MVGTPVKFGDCVPAPHLNAPLLGEHSAEILKALGYSEDQIKALNDAQTTIVR